MNNRVSQDSPTWKRVEGLLLQLRVARTTSKKQRILKKNLLTQFRRYPHLANERYHIKVRGGARLTPLACLIEARMGISALESLFECMDPSVMCHLNMRGIGRGSVFHMACADRSDEVIRLLLSKLEESGVTKGILSREDRNGKLAFDLALENSGLQLSTKRQLLEVCPEAVRNGDLLARLLRFSHLKMLEIVVSIWPSTQTHVNLINWGRFGDQGIWILDKVRPFCELFPKLNSICYCRPQWEISAFRYFLNKLECNKSIVNMDGIVLPRLDRWDNSMQQNVIHDFQKMLRKNTTLKHLGIESHSSIATALSWMQTIDNSAQQNHASLEKLYVKSNGYFELDTAYWTTERHRSNARWPNQIQNNNLPLSLNMPNMEKFDAFDRALVLDALPRFSQLLTVGITLNESTNERILQVASFVVALLNSEHQFQHLHLTLSNLSLVLKIFGEALFANRKLLSFGIWETRQNLPQNIASNEVKETWLTMLKEHNFILSTCNFMACADARIEHYLDLNRFGRSEVRGTVTPLRRTKLIAHLIDSWNDPMLSLQANRRQSIAYGLLRENPDLWCHPAHESSINNNAKQDRKRKRASA